MRKLKQWILSIFSHGVCSHMYIEHMRGNVFKCPDCNCIFVMKDAKMIEMLKSFIE